MRQVNLPGLQRNKGTPTIKKKIYFQKKLLCLFRWGSETGEFGIKQIVKAGSHFHRAKIAKLTFRALTLRRHFPIRFRR